jgi:hypothetical protein
LNIIQKISFSFINVFDNTFITHHSASKQIILREHWKLIFGLRLKVVQWDVNGYKRECRSKRGGLKRECRSKR